MKNYIIVTPPNIKSNGARALYLLADYLIEKGYKVSLFSYAPYTTGYNYIEQFTEEMKENDIIVYPENIKGNPLGFKNIVRWILYFPGKNGGESTYHLSEQLFTWSKLFYKEAPELSFFTIDRKIFYDDNRPKKHNSYYVYKGGQCRHIPEIENAIRIDQYFPSKREELGELLRDTEILYSYDEYSILLDEALLCGVKVKVVTLDEIYDYTMNFEDALTNIEENLCNFIEITQKMNYTGPLQPPVSNMFRRLQYRLRIGLGRLLKDSKKIYRYRLRY